MSRALQCARRCRRGSPPPREAARSADREAAGLSVARPVSILVFDRQSIWMEPSDFFAQNSKFNCTKGSYSQSDAQKDFGVLRWAVKSAFCPQFSSLETSHQRVHQTNKTRKLESKQSRLISSARRSHTTHKATVFVLLAFNKCAVEICDRAQLAACSFW